MSKLCLECERLKDELEKTSKLLIEKAQLILMVRRALEGAYCDFPDQDQGEASVPP